ncbi:MAG: sigma-70 family RNA polymerase sigma factor [Ekhidna sp.]
MTTKNLISLFENKKSLEELYKRLFPSIEKHVLNNSGNTQDAKDIFQESIIVAYKKVHNPDFKLSSTIDTFVYSIAKNKWLHVLRSSKRMMKTPESEISDDPRIDEILFEEERRNLFVAHFGRLSEGCKNLFEFFFKGMSMEKIADAMNLGSAGYVRKKKHLCQEKLIEAIKKDPLYKELKNG